MTRVPPSDEVAREHVRRCPAPGCRITDAVCEVLERGTPDQRAELLALLTDTQWRVFLSVLRDAL